MGTRDARIDAYIRKSADFARPILERLRADLHACCPGIVETVKWKNPSFEYRGLLCGFAAFKRHCAFGFWKHDLVVGDDPKADEAMGSFGRITSLKDLPARSVFRRYVRKAMRLNEQGVTMPRKRAGTRKAIPMHPAFKKALQRDRKASAAFAGFSPSQQREYLEWIAEAKHDETRERRIEQSVAWLAEGKPRNWKYMKR